MDTNDSMSLIFQFLDERANDYKHCSLVSSHWLYHAMNPNSITYLRLYTFIKEFKLAIDENDTVEGHIRQRRAIREWQKYTKYIIAKTYINT